jgi:hypothetical protein
VPEPSDADVELEVQHVAVLDGVFLAFLAQLAGILGAVSPPSADVVVIGDGFGADEAALHVGMDFAGGFGALAPLMDRPGARFLGADGEEGDQVQQVVARARSRGRGRFRAGPASRNTACGLRPGCRQLGFDGGRDTITALAPSALAFSNTLAEKALPVARRFFLDIADIEHRLGGEQLRLGKYRALFLVGGLGQPGRLAFAQQPRAPSSRTDGEQLRFLVALRGLLLCRPATRFSRLSRSASISSVSTVSASDTGSILPVDVL